ncbi:microcin C transport system permease protein [Andreprevotia lacus DSM 23236]|jgi:microcin C transport system permease protein|uniref:Microcin C transport system permease protein n=1 Tax=Andreprevotia lacus DSM 23236 TaxID=1121001 RepID=A0A1W1XDD4_9NEIS|nr:ABC transporter permease [Andreprevotia lacus]SMC21814.1 microcin C transport system permease protein [Andreprevotia lacus DSM 23236]
MSVAMNIGPWRRAWLRFRKQRRAYFSLWLLAALLVLSCAAELLSNDKPLLVHYQGQTYYPMFKDYPETVFGGDFPSPADFLDPFIQQQLTRDGNWALFAPNHYGPNTLNYFSPSPNPAAPSAVNWLGTDDRGRDVLARLLYGFRVSLLFGLALTAAGVVVGLFFGAIQGYFAGRVDLTMQRLLEVWSSMPELYLLLILTSMFKPSLLVLFTVLSIFGWMGLSDYVRGEFLRNRNLEYVTAARALGLTDWQIIRRHLLPNSLTSVIAFLPFRMSGAVVALTSFDFLGLGVPQEVPSLGELLAQGKANMDAWWISLPTFGVLVGMLLLLVFVGEGLRAALDVRADH